MASHRVGRALLLLVVLASSPLACEESTPQPEPSARAGARSAEVDLSKYCGNVCRRSTACGLEAAESIVRGTSTEVSRLSRMKDDAPKTEARCREACTAQAPPTDDAALVSLQACLSQSTCEALEACLAAASP